MPEFDDIIKGDQASWANYHKTQAVTPLRHVRLENDAQQDMIKSYNRTSRAMQSLVREALERHEHLRSYGGAWSFSNAAVSNGILINSRNLNYLFEFGAEHLHTDYGSPPSRLRLVQCGKKIAGLHNHLEGLGLSLPTCGASNGQTIAGALSTGTHGAGLRVGAVPEYVVALHLVVSPTRQVWLERSSLKVTKDQLCGTVFGADLLRADDDLFNAALVSFGSFGLIAGVVIETVPRFFLKKFAKKVKLSNLAPMLSTLNFQSVTLPGPVERLFHLEVRINPFKTDDAHLTTMYLFDALPAGAVLLDPPGELVVSGDLTRVVAALSASKLATVLIGNAWAALGLKEIDGKWGSLAEVFPDTTSPSGGASTAMGIPIADVNHALTALLALHAVEKPPVIFALRYVKSTSATLGFTCHGNVTCVLEIDGVNDKKGRTQEFYQAAWQTLRDLGIPLTMHWGKMHDLDTQAKVRLGYGDARVDQWLEQRRVLLPTQELRDVFANAMVRRAGLNA